MSTVNTPNHPGLYTSSEYIDYSENKVIYRTSSSHAECDSIDLIVI